MDSEPWTPQRDDLPFPRSLPEPQQLFPDEAKCAAYWKKLDGATASSVRIAAAGDPFRIGTRPGVLAVASAATIRA